ncbi:GGDEF domain-containing protein [Streptomyces cucumeris]|uniref:GGDEF domain-containing protein n=1 Tax=Streptomyces cucumeris TaxID=2962890 RepID=UPI003D75C1FE
MSHTLTALAAAVPLAAGWTVHGLWQRNLIDRAGRDALTGLPRRATFEKAGARILRKTRQGLVAVLVIDLDGFKQINDIHGHAAGDIAIRETGHRLAQWAEPLGAVARLGGDEFAAAIRCADVDAVRGELTHLHQWLCSIVTYEGRPLPLGVSIGAYRSTPDGPAPDLSSALRAADEAMYGVKQTGGGWTIKHTLSPDYRTVNGRRDGRRGTDFDLELDGGAS